MEDPNWFYSSISQCAASLIGLVGAVIAARLAQQSEAMRNSYDGTAESLLRFREKFNARVESVEVYTEFIKDRIDQVTAALQRGETEIYVDREVEFCGGSSSSSESRKVPVDNTLLMHYSQSASCARAASECLIDHIEVKTVCDMREAMQAFTDLESGFPPQYRCNIVQLTPLVDRVENDNRFHQNVSRLRIPFAFTLILLWLCYFGIVDPILYLSAYDFTSKNRIFLAFSAGVLAIPAYLLMELKSMRRLKTVDLSSRITFKGQHYHRGS